MSQDMLFHVPPKYAEELRSTSTMGSKFRVVDEQVMARVASCWFTNIEHGRRHDPLRLMNMEDNKRFNKRIAKNPNSYVKYDNYDAIEIPFASGIPSDYDGVMGVPISFLDKYNPEQFEIVGCSYNYGRPDFWPDDTVMSSTINGKSTYKRLFIRHINPETTNPETTKEN